MRVYIHKETGRIMIVYHVFARIEEPLMAFDYVGLGCENEHGITFILPDDVLECFELVGDL